MPDSFELDERAAGKIRLPSLSAWRQAEQLAAGNAVAGRFWSVPIDFQYLDRSLVDSLADSVGRQPDSAAIVTAEKTITYRQLWNLVACYGNAITNAEAPPGPVALAIRDYAAAAASLFAGLIAGRPCLALDCAHPAERNTALIRAAGATLVAVLAGDEEALASAAATKVLVLDDATVELPNAPASLPTRLGVDEPAFILPTSGSTGTPKLVVHSQRTEAYRANQRGDAAGQTAGDRVLLCGGPPTSYSGIGNVLAPIRAGATMHLFDLRKEGVRGLLQRLGQERITVLLAGSSLLRTVVDLPGAREAMAHLRLVRTGGEATTHADIALLRAVVPQHCQFETGYGATEATNLRWPIPRNDTRHPLRVPAGYPEPGGTFLILDDDGAVCPPGAAGELVVRSRYNALGEWQNGHCVPGRLIRDPDEPDQRIYFTGDIAQQTEDGVFIILGRKDRQVKINGQRVEPIEIEAAIRAIPGVLDAFVLPRTSGQTTILLAFVAAGVNASPAMEASLRQTLQTALPRHMVPAHIAIMAELPRMPGGKPDGVRMLASIDG